MGTVGYAPGTALEMHGAWMPMQRTTGSLTTCTHTAKLEDAYMQFMEKRCLPTSTQTYKGCSYDDESSNLQNPRKEKELCLCTKHLWS